jgi:hypothetical protein
MPLTKTQSEVAKLLAQNRSEESHLAGGSAAHFSPRSFRYSEDLDYFHDTIEALTLAFEQDQKTLVANNFKIEVDLHTPGYIRALVHSPQGACKVEWSRDSSWRFMPTQKHPDLGYVLHPTDLVVNKLLALAGRDEARDYLDVIYNHQTILPLGAQCWAACGKDPGFSPHSLLDLLRRKGKFRKEDFEKLHLSDPKEVDLQKTKQSWLEALDLAEKFISHAPADEVGCLYYSEADQAFVSPSDQLLKSTAIQRKAAGIVPHYGRPGGILPSLS